LAKLHINRDGPERRACSDVLVLLFGAPKPESRELIETWAPGRGIENFVASATIEARKPRGDVASRE
jgi:hypothetical protein